MKVRCGIGTIDTGQSELQRTAIIEKEDGQLRVNDGHGMVSSRWPNQLRTPYRPSSHTPPARGESLAPQQAPGSGGAMLQNCLRDVGDGQPVAPTRQPLRECAEQDGRSAACEGFR